MLNNNNTFHKKTMVLQAKCFCHLSPCQLRDGISVMLILKVTWLPQSKLSPISWETASLNIKFQTTFKPKWLKNSVINSGWGGSNKVSSTVLQSQPKGSKETYSKLIDEILTKKYHSNTF